MVSANSSAAAARAGAGADELDPAAFRAAMASFPSGVTVVTTRDAAGRPHGFTASSFCSVSLDPPLILVCLARSANCFEAFRDCARFAVSILQPQHTELAQRFASKTADKFAYGRFTTTASGLVVVDDAVAVVDCSVHRRVEAGDHIIMVGEVHEVRLGGGTPVVYLNRGFGTVSPVTPRRPTPG
jgi:flavin reductase ActVB